MLSSKAADSQQRNSSKSSARLKKHRKSHRKARTVNLELKEQSMDYICSKHMQQYLQQISLQEHIAVGAKTCGKTARNFNTDFSPFRKPQRKLLCLHNKTINYSIIKQNLLW